MSSEYRTSKTKILPQAQDPGNRNSIMIAN